ncbi:MAG: helix-turn-helix transcriptional regulator [Caulobacteraceae bacterium]|nr:helix-turn-helix transcriptional regulator [Caulobacteraceae bacterium]
MIERSEPDPIDIAIGARIRLRRRGLGMTQEVLAQHLGLTFQQVQKYEKGVNRVSGSTLVRVAQALRMRPGVLLGDDDVEAVEAVDWSNVATPGAAELMSAFAAIKSPRVRSSVLALVKAATAATEDHDRTDEP